MTSPGDLTVVPNPAHEGQEVQINYQGSGQVRYSIDGGEWEDLPLDANGNAKLTAPVGATTIAISDMHGNDAIVLIESTG